MADCDLQTFAAGGKGGQRQNTCNTAVRIIHRASGARGEARDERSQWANKKLAWRRMYESKEFQLWLRRTTGQLAVAEAMIDEIEVASADLQFETRHQGRWVRVDEASLRA
jgi:protein subunit release factor B